MKKPRINECGHPDIPHLAKGKCAHCYWSAQYARPEFKARQAIYNSSPEVKFRKSAYGKVYRAKPENKARKAASRDNPESKSRRKAYDKEYRAKPEVKARRTEYRKVYEATPKAKAKKAAYRNRPEVKARMIDYHKVYDAVYHARPEVKDRRAVYNAIPEVRARKYCGANKTDYGETLLWFLVPVEDRCCWLCGCGGQSLKLDHNHKTLKIRGWTHAVCNTAEGMIMKSPNPTRLLATLATESSR